MKKEVITITGTEDIEFMDEQVYVSHRTWNGRKCRVYDLTTNCKREVTAVKRLVSVVPELEAMLDGCGNELCADCDSLAIEATETGFYVRAVIFEDENEEVIEVNDNNHPYDKDTTYHHISTYPETHHVYDAIITMINKDDALKQFFKALKKYRYIYKKYNLNNSDIIPSEYPLTLGDNILFTSQMSKGWYIELCIYDSECNNSDADTNIKKENENMNENLTVVDEVMEDIQEVLPIEPEYITRAINEANLVNQELLERTRSILYLEEDNRRNLFKIASQLAQISNDKLYADDGFKNVSEYGEKVLGYKSSTTRALCRIADRFLSPTGEIKNPELLDYTVYQLMELLKLNDSELHLALNEGTVSPELSTKKIRENIKKSKETEDKGDKPEGKGKEYKEKKEDEAPVTGETKPDGEGEIKHPDNRGEIIVILTSLITQIRQNQNISTDLCESYTEQIKRAIHCIK